MKTAILYLLGLWGYFAAAAAFAAESPAYEQLKDLERFVGSWESQTVIPESPSYSKTAKQWQGKPLLLRLNITWTAGKSAQILDTVFEVPGEVTINSTMLWGWDQTAGKIKGTRFTSHKGVWSETMEKQGDVWVSHYTGSNLDGARCTGTTTFTFPDSDTMVMADTEQTVDGKPLPDVTYQCKRVGTPHQPSNHEKLKELSVFAGEWDAQTEQGGCFHWVFRWTEDKNFLMNVITGKDVQGNVTMSNKGFMGWDPNYRRISNWCVDSHGNRPVFLWEKQTDGSWHTWAPGGGYSGSVTILSDGTFCVDGSGEKLHFKRVAER